MGYTSYFTVNEKLDEQKFQEFSKECKLLHDNLPEFSESAGGYRNDVKIIICGGDGTGEPEFTDELVCFNGTEVNDMFHETFAISKDQMGFEFCKTARKPYDLLVCACLISAKRHFGESIKISSDGGDEDWKPANDFYAEVTKKEVPNVLEEESEEEPF